jgi:hypothetical protein
MHMIRHASGIEATIDPADPRRAYDTAVPMGDETARGLRMFSTASLPTRA